MKIEVTNNVLLDALRSGGNLALAERRTPIGGYDEWGKQCFIRLTTEDDRLIVESASDEASIRHVVVANKSLCISKGGSFLLAPFRMVQHLEALGGMPFGITMEHVLVCPYEPPDKVEEGQEGWLTFVAKSADSRSTAELTTSFPVFPADYFHGRAYVAPGKHAWLTVRAGALRINLRPSTGGSRRRSRGTRMRQTYWVSYRGRT